MVEQISFDFGIPVEEEKPKVVVPLPQDSLKYLEKLIAQKECLIFMIGGNPGLRFIRTFSSKDIGEDWNNGLGCTVVYEDAKKVLKEAKYYCSGKHTFSRYVGNTGNKLTADVWRRR